MWMHDRRDFLSLSSRAAFGIPLMTLGCARDDERRDAVAATGRWAALIAHLEQEIPSRLERARATPGAAMALIADAKLLWSQGFGVTDRASSQPVTAATVFEFGSVSKTVFAYAVMKACDRGVLALDAPLTRYGASRPLDDPRLDLVTARHVLSHTAGFQNWRSKEEPLRMKFTPGAGWEYSGEGYYYLQSVLSHVAGSIDASDCRTMWDEVRVCSTDFDAYMKRNLFDPFGMTASGYVFRDGMARPHDGKGELISDRKSTRFDVARYGSAGQLHSTVDDYAKFLIEVIDPRPADDARLTAAMRAEMIKPQVKLTDVLWWGLGWLIERHPGMGDIVAHSGDNPGFKAMTAASPAPRSAFIVVTNGDRGFDDVIRPILQSAPMRAFLPVTV